MHSQSVEELEALCRRHGLPLTVQRRVVLEVLISRKDHPTADQVFEDLQGCLRGVSRTTVYRILEVLVKKGIARKVCHPAAVARFEIMARRHHHLLCVQCGRLADFEDPSLDAIVLPKVRDRDFELKDYSIQFRGIRSGCARIAARAAKSRAQGRGRKTTSADRRIT